MGWVSPSGFNDDSSTWSSESLVYDENTGTYAYTLVPKGGWSGYLGLTIDAVNCDRVQGWFNQGTVNISNFELDVYYGSAWHNIQNVEPVYGQYVEFLVGSTQSVTAARFKFYSTKAASDGGQCYEFDFWEVPTGPTLDAYNKILYTSEPPTPNAWNQIKREAGTGWKKLLYT